jgi:hypothetical protein
VPLQGRSCTQIMLLAALVLTEMPGMTIGAVSFTRDCLADRGATSSQATGAGRRRRVKRRLAHSFGDIVSGLRTNASPRTFLESTRAPNKMLEVHGDIELRRFDLKMD